MGKAFYPLPAPDFIAPDAGEPQQLPAHAAEEVRVLFRLFAAADEGGPLPSVEHPVAGGAVADAPAQKLRLPGVQLFPGDAGSQDHRPCLIKGGTHRHAEAFPKGQHRKGPSANLLRAAIHKLLMQQRGKRRSADLLNSRVIGHLFRLVKITGLIGVGNHAHRFPPADAGQRRRHPGDAAADDDNIKAVRHGSCSFLFLSVFCTISLAHFCCNYQYYRL